MLWFLDFFFFNYTATTEIYTLSLHDALPIFSLSHRYIPSRQLPDKAVSLLDTACSRVAMALHATPARSEEHTSELQSRLHLVCRLLLEKKKKLDSRAHNASDRRLACTHATYA